MMERLNTPDSNRKHIAFFGRRNAGKSSIFNLLLNQEISLVSDVPGTTTDPVYKSMELIGYGPVRIIDTAGLDDVGSLGRMRVEKTEEILQKTDLAIYVLNAEKIDKEEKKEAKLFFQRFRIPYVFVWNKLDQLKEEERKKLRKENSGDSFLDENINLKRENLLEIILKNLKEQEEDPPLIGDLAAYGSTVVLVVPIDSEAPKGRLILPQVQVIRECLDNGIKTVVVRETELEETIKEIQKIDLVITDSQVFKTVDKIVPAHIPLTSFSMLFARQKGDIREFIKGIEALEELKNKKEGTVLIAESCTHTTSHEDIGTVKIPNLLKKKINPNLKIIFQNGATFKEKEFNMENVDLIIHCGSCMITRKNMLNRIRIAEEKGVPITNYGVTLAYLTGILDRAIKGTIRE
jgi:hydrogenase maturation GTPase hydF